MEILEKDTKVNDNLINLKKSDSVLNTMKANLYKEFQKEKTQFMG